MRNFSRGHSRTNGLELGFLLICFVLFLAPIAMMIINAFRSGVPGAQTGWTLDGIRDGLLQARMITVLWQTVVYAAVVSLLSTLGSVYFAWLCARTKTPLRRVLPFVMIAIVATPALFYAIAFDALANERVGLLNVLIRSVIGGEAGPLNIQSWAGLVLVASIKSTAFSFAIILPAFLRMSHSLEEAAKMSGARQGRVLVGITLPVLMPSVIGAAILSFIHALESFEAPLVLGSPAGIDVLSTQVLAFLQAVTGPNYAAASSLALPIVFLIIVLLYWQRSAMGQREFTTVGGRSAGNRLDSLGSSRWIHSGVILLFIIIALVLPILQVLATSVSTRPGNFTEFTLRHYEFIFSTGVITDSIRNTWVLASVGGFAVGVFCTVSSWVVQRSRSRFVRASAQSIWLSIALPGILLGVAVFSLIMVFPGARVLYGTLWLLFIGLFIAAVPIAMRGADGSVRQIHPELYEAARVHGARPTRGWLGTIAPLLIPGTLSAWFIAAIVIAANVAVPLLLSTPSATLMAVEALNRFREGYVQVASGIVVVNLAIWGLALMLVLLTEIIRILIRRRTDQIGSLTTVEQE